MIEAKILVPITDFKIYYIAFWNLTCHYRTIYQLWVMKNVIVEGPDLVAVLIKLPKQGEIIMRDVLVLVR